MKVYKPTPGNGFMWGIGLTVFSVAILVLPILLSRNEGSFGRVFIAVMGLMGFLLAGIMGYFTWAAKNLEYRIDEDQLIITWAFNQKKIPIGTIKAVGKIKGTSAMKLAGTSWPGFHWGSFADPRGKGSINLYATRLKGDIILLKTKRETIGITPERPEEFLEDLVKSREWDKDHAKAEEWERGLTEFGGEEEQFAPFRDKIFMGMLLLSLVIMAGTGIFLAKEIHQLPDQVPMHYNLAGEVDRYGSPEELWVPFGIGVVSNILVFGFSLIAGINNKVSAYMVGIIGVFVALIFCVMVAGMVFSAP